MILILIHLLILLPTSSNHSKIHGIDPNGNNTEQQLDKIYQSNLPASLNPQKILHQSAPHTAKHLNHKVPQSLWSVTRHAKQLSPQPRHNRLNQDMLSLDNSHKYNSRLRGGHIPKREFMGMSPFTVVLRWIHVKNICRRSNKQKSCSTSKGENAKKYTKYMINYTMSSCSQLHCQNIHMYTYI